MLKYQLNQLDVDIKCEFKGAFLIRDGRYNKDAMKKTFPHARPEEHQAWPNSVFISRSPVAEIMNAAKDAQRLSQSEALQYYVPGSSIRGWLRSHAEKIVRTRSDDARLLCCDPFDNDKDDATGCSKRLQKMAADKSPKYRYACMICRLFGCGDLAARLSFSDGEFAKGKERFQVRIADGIGIDRFTGGTASVMKADGKASGVKFANQVLENGAFTFHLTLRNFEIWQLGLLAFVLRDLEQGTLKLGFGKTKGFGQITGHAVAGALTYWRSPKDDRLAGIADLMPTLVDDYDAKKFAPEDQRPLLAKIDGDEMALGKSYSLAIPDEKKPEKITDLPFWKSCAEQWLHVVPSFKSISELDAEAFPAPANPPMNEPAKKE